ncbi:MAG TPA: ROK family protein [Planctomycetota bacterium]
MSDVVIGFDVGGTRLKSGAVDRRGRLLAEGITPSDATAGPERLLKRLVAETARLSKRVRPRAIALGFPGAVDPEKGVVLLPGRLDGLENFPLVPKLAAKTGLPVFADNDARLAMLAEARYGLAKGETWALTVTLGTGVGTCPLLDGKILRDPHFQFGTQMSHMVMQSRDGRLCFTGARGTAEMLCSATALASQVRDGLARGIPSILADRWQADPHAIDCEAVMEAVARKDRLACDELRVWTEHLGWFLVSAIHAYAPRIVILAGGATHGARHFLKPLRAQVAAHVFRWPRHSAPALVISKMRDHAGVLGAAALAWENLG